jgi:predicted GNAT family N-acyltransferase
MDVVEFGSLTDAIRAELEGDEEDPFEGAGNTLQWRRKERHVALRGDDGRLVASTGLLVTSVTVDDGPVRPVVGIGGVIVVARCRGQGLSTVIVREALRVAATLGPDAVILFCHPDRAGLYLKHGFVELAAPVFVEQPGGAIAEMPDVTMWRSVGEEAAAPPLGRIVVNGLPF